MARSKRSKVQANELFDSWKEKLYSFSAAMLPESLAVEVSLAAMSHVPRRLARTKVSAESAHIELFACVWEEIQLALDHSFARALNGRDTRLLKNSGSDLLEGVSGGRGKSVSVDRALAVERLDRVDAELRATMVLHDILRLPAEDVIEILGLRWGVFRQRLHRSRIEFLEALHGDRVRKLADESNA